MIYCPRRTVEIASDILRWLSVIINRDLSYIAGETDSQFPAMGDFHIGNLFYVTRGIVTPHFDYSFIGKARLLSVGATLEIEFGNFIGPVFNIDF